MEETIFWIRLSDTIRHIGLLYRKEHWHWILTVGKTKRLSGIGNSSQFSGASTSFQVHYSPSGNIRVEFVSITMRRDWACVIQRVFRWLEQKVFISKEENFSGEQKVRHFWVGKCCKPGFLLYWYIVNFWGYHFFCLFHHKLKPVFSGNLP